MIKRCAFLILIFCIVFCCCACKEETPAPTQPALPTVVGSWNARIDMTEHINQMLKSQMGIDHLTTEFSFVLCLALSEDGTYSLSYDQDHLSDQLETMGKILWQMVVDQAAAQSGITTAEASTALEEQGKNQQVLVDELKLVTFFDNTFVKNGFWKHENDKLYISDVADGFTEENAVSAVLSGDQLTLSYQVGVDEEEKPIMKSVVFDRA